MNLLSVESIALTVFDYPLSWIELIGTILYLASVILIARRNILTWPIGIVSVILYMLLFYQIRLYADTVEQVYYLGASIYGWWWWGRRTEPQSAPTIRYSTSQTMIVTVIIILTLGGIVGAFFQHAHLTLPSIFTAPAAYPWLDSLTTVMSFAAMALMARKRTESWVLWIMVDVIGIGLYFAQGVRFLSLLYVILLVIAINGWITWHRDPRRAPAALPA